MCGCVRARLIGCVSVCVFACLVDRFRVRSFVRVSVWLLVCLEGLLGVRHVICVLVCLLACVYACLLVCLCACFFVRG